MKRRILSVVMALALCLSLLPAPARAAGTPTRTERLVLYEMTETTENTEEGWKWEPDTKTLTLKNCYIKSDNVLIIMFPDSDEAHLVLEGTNIIETSSASYNCIIATSQSGQGKLKVSGSGSLTVTATTAGISNPPYIFNGSTLTIEDGATIHANIDLCTINQNFTMNGGSVILAGEYVKYGIYINAGDVVINNGNLKIDAGVTGMFLPGIPPTTRTNNVKISGGTVNINAPTSAIHINHREDNPEGTEQIEITGGEVNLTANSRAFQGKTITVGENAKLNVQVKNGDGLSVIEGRNVTLAAGTYTGSTNTFNITAADTTLADLLSPGYAIFNEADGTGVDRTKTSTGPGTFTVKKCTHEGATATPINGTETHSVSCPACGYTADAEACAYGDYEYDETNHWQTCTLCGREKTEAHTRAAKWSPDWNEREVTITYPCEKECGYTEICGKVTVSADHLELPYGQTQTLSLTSTLPESTFTWTLSSDQGDGELTDTTLSTESRCTLPGDWNVGTYHVSWAVAWTGNGGQTVDGGVFVTVTPATLSGKPTFGSGEGKTLGEVEVTLPESWPAGGTFAWEAGADTQVVRGTSYAYTYTSPDGNYAASGSVILWAAPSASGGGGGGTSQTTPPVSTGTTTEGGTPTTETTAAPSASVSGGKATATVDTSTGQEIIKQAVENGSETVVIAPKVTGDVSRTEVSIPASTVGQIGSQTNASLTVSTPVADVTIPNGGLGSLGSAGGTVTVAAEKTGNTVELSVTAGGRAVESVPGGVTLTVPAEDAAPGTVAVLIREDGTREVVRKSVTGDGSITIPLDGSAKLEIVDNGKRFADVPATGWVAEAAAFVSSHELFNGTAPGRFSPDAPMSRGMLAVVLHNLENNPAQALTGAFADVDNGRWYAEGVAWAAASGIVSGYGNGQFGPDDNITREQAAVMLWRYAGSPAAADRELRFADAGKASGWAVDALCWAVERGILDEKDGGILDPTGQATRAEAAQMLKNFMERR